MSSVEKDIIFPLLVLAVGVALLAFLLGMVVFRRYMLTRVVGSFDCSMRRDSGAEVDSWVVGVARYERDRLDWFRALTIDPRPARTLIRADLEILERRDPYPAEEVTLLPGWVVVRCSYQALTLELAMSFGDYNGLAAWLESAPPGQNVNIA